MISTFIDESLRKSLLDKHSVEIVTGSSTKYFDIVMCNDRPQISYRELEDIENMMGAEYVMADRTYITFKWRKPCEKSNRHNHRYINGQWIREGDAA